jgi:hypothetical protein
MAAGARGRCLVLLEAVPGARVGGGLGRGRDVVRWLGKVLPEKVVNRKDPKMLREVTRMQFDNLVAAFACDLTRIATVMFFDWRADPYIWNFPPVNNPTYLHLLSHDFLDQFVVAKRPLPFDISTTIRECL